MSAAGRIERNTITLTDQAGDVTFSDTNGNNQPETFFDLTVPTATEYRLLPSRKMPQRDQGLFLRLNLDDSGPSDLPDDAQVRIIVQGPSEEDEQQIGGTISLRQFNNADQFDSEEVYRLQMDKEYRLKEDRHLKIQVISSTAVSASDSWAELEIVRLTA